MLYLTGIVVSIALIYWVPAIIKWMLTYKQRKILHNLSYGDKFEYGITDNTHGYQPFGVYTFIRKSKVQDNIYWVKQLGEVFTLEITPSFLTTVKLKEKRDKKDNLELERIFIKEYVNTMEQHSDDEIKELIGSREYTS